MKSPFVFLLLLCGYGLTILSCDPPEDPDPEDNCIVPALNFSQVATFSSANFITHEGTDLVGSADAVFVIERATASQERVHRIDVATNAVNVVLNSGAGSDFITKRGFFSNGELRVFGVQKLNTYTSLPLAATHSRTHSPDLGNWFDAAHDGGQYVYIAGGVDGGIATGNGITPTLRRYDLNTNTYASIGTFPAPMVLPGLEHHNGKLYAFGGYDAQTDINTTAVPKGFVYDLVAQTTTAITTLPYGLHRGYTARKNDCIFVAGRSLNPHRIRIGIYNTQTGSFTDIPHNLSDPVLKSSVYGMAIAGDFLYVLYHDVANAADVYSVMRAPL